VEAEYEYHQYKTALYVDENGDPIPLDSELGQQIQKKVNEGLRKSMEIRNGKSQNKESNEESDAG
jgi:hypothetical protein